MEVLSCAVLLGASVGGEGTLLNNRTLTVDYELSTNSMSHLQSPLCLLCACGTSIVAAGMNSTCHVLSTVQYCLYSCNQILATWALQVPSSLLPVFLSNKQIPSNTPHELVYNYAAHTQVQTHFLSAGLHYTRSCSLVFPHLIMREIIY